MNMFVQKLPSTHASGPFLKLSPWKALLCLLIGQPTYQSFLRSWILNPLCIKCLFFSLLIAVSRLYISVMGRPCYVLHCIILELLIILMFAISTKVLFNLSFDSLAFFMVSSMNIYFPSSYLQWAVTLNIWIATEPGDPVYLVQGQQCPKSLPWYTP